MKPFLLMLSFFTRLPVPRVEYTDERYVKGMNLIPLVGVFTGGILYGVSYLDRYMARPVVGVLLFFVYLLITGGLHMDGLADSCDALFSSRDREKMLEIMKDSRSGSFGVLGLIVASASYLVLLCYVPRQALFLFPIIGKCAPAVGAAFAGYVRPQGMGKLFCDNCSAWTIAIALGVVNLAGAAMGMHYVIAADVGLLSCFLLTKKIKTILGGVTGDILGLLCETSQLVFLLAIYCIELI